MQAEGVRYRLKDAEQRVSLSLYCTHSACASGVPQPVLHILYTGCLWKGNFVKCNVSGFRVGSFCILLFSCGVCLTNVVYCIPFILQAAIASRSSTEERRKGENEIMHLFSPTPDSDFDQSDDNSVPTYKRLGQVIIKVKRRLIHQEILFWLLFGTIGSNTS